jgi:predicted flap endonuclease-1-like 5' DNA nuclease
MRPSAPPGEFLMPRPSAPPPAATRSAGALDLTPSPADPWRERIAQLEVQLAAARAESARRAEESAQLRARLDALEPMARSATEQLASMSERMERALAEARGWAERPLPVGALEGRMSEVESLAASVRASVATAAHDIAEHGRMFDARATRMASLESRIALVERDPEKNELRLAGERLELRVAALAKTLEQLSHEVRDRVARAEHRADESEKHALRAASDAQKALARSHEAIDAQDALREEAKLDALLPRLADVEALVLENGRNDALQRKRLDALEARMGAGTHAGTPAEPRAEAPATAPEAARGAEENGDDLRRIKGIGPAYAKALRAMGVSRFADIAAWDDAALARVAEALGTKKDRLAKWTEKARALVAGGD